MFGLSFAKLALLLAMVAAVWLVFRWFNRRVARVVRRVGQAPAAGPVAAKAEDLTACLVCGVFVAAGVARACGRADCPYPRR